MGKREKNKPFVAWISSGDSDSRTRIVVVENGDGRPLAIVEQSLHRDRMDEHIWESITGQNAITNLARAILDKIELPEWARGVRVSS